MRKKRERHHGSETIAIPGTIHERYFFLKQLETPVICSFSDCQSYSFIVK